MRIIANAYKHLGRKLKDEVLDDADRPAFNWVDMWYEQTEFPDLAEGIDYPALFFDFASDEIKTIGLLEQDVTVFTTLYVAVNTLDDTYLEAAEAGEGLHYFELCARIHELLQGYDHPDVGNLTRVGFAPVSTATNIVVYRITYQSTIMDTSATEVRRATVEGPAGPIDGPARRFMV